MLLRPQQSSTQIVSQSSIRTSHAAFRYATFHDYIAARACSRMLLSSPVIASCPAIWTHPSHRPPAADHFSHTVRDPRAIVALCSGAPAFTSGLSVPTVRQSASPRLLPLSPCAGCRFQRSHCSLLIVDCNHIDHHLKTRSLDVRNKHKTVSACLCKYLQASEHHQIRPVAITPFVDRFIRWLLHRVSSRPAVARRRRRPSFRVCSLCPPCSALPSPPSPA